MIDIHLNLSWLQLMGYVVSGIYLIGLIILVKKFWLTPPDGGFIAISFPRLYEAIIILLWPIILLWYACRFTFAIVADFLSS